MLKVLQPGFYATIQDRGRLDYLSLGVPISGVMDAYAAELANRMLNNNFNDAVLELLPGRTVLQFLEPTSFCITGADFFCKLNGQSISVNFKYGANKNDVLEFGKPQFGTRAYLAVKEGFTTEKILGSRSQFRCITKQVQLRKEDLIPYEAYNSDNEKTNAAVKMDVNHFDSNILECYEGPEFHELDEIQKAVLLYQTFTISKDNNRMGYRMEETIQNQIPQIITSSVLPGTVQLTPSGKLIVLMRDCQVTGGYPRILQLNDISISRLSQKNTGQKVQFGLKKQ